MSTTRCFLLASSLARLIEKERGGHRVVEGYFPVHGDRSCYVQVQEQACRLVLITTSSGAMIEEPTELPHSHAETLCNAAAGRVAYVQSALSFGSCQVQISRFAMPGPLDRVTVRFANDRDARAFEPPPWFGPEVTHETSYQNRLMALKGLPPVPEVPFTDVALHSLLDTLQGEGEAPSLTVRQSAHALTQKASDPTRAESHDEALAIEDSVIQELAWCLRPQRR